MASLYGTDTTYAIVVAGDFAAGHACLGKRKRAGAKTCSNPESRQFRPLPSHRPIASYRGAGAIRSIHSRQFAMGRNSALAQVQLSELPRINLQTLPIHSLSPSRHQVDDKHDHRNDQQDVNQAASNVKTEAQEPENQNDYKYCPQHTNSFYTPWAPKSLTGLERPHCSSAMNC
jgi:hypothetical protein